MTTPREIIAEQSDGGARAPDRILGALTAAGFHILSDADLQARDDAVLEKAALRLESTRSALGPIAVTAIRAMQGGKP